MQICVMLRLEIRIQFFASSSVFRLTYCLKGIPVYFLKLWARVDGEQKNFLLTNSMVG